MHGIVEIDPTALAHGLDLMLAVRKERDPLHVVPDLLAVVITLLGPSRVGNDKVAAAISHRQGAHDRRRAPVLRQRLWALLPARHDHLEPVAQGDGVVPARERRQECVAHGVEDRPICELQRSAEREPLGREDERLKRGAIVAVRRPIRLASGD